MASGPYILDNGVPLDAGKVFPNIHVCAGAGFKHWRGMGVKAALDADATWRGSIPLPPIIPTGTPKIRLISLAGANSGVAKVTIKLALCGDNQDPSGLTMVAEAQQTITWGGTDSDKRKVTIVTLANTIPLAGDALKDLLVDLVFNTSGWTLAQVSTWRARLDWE